MNNEQTVRNDSNFKAVNLSVKPTNDHVTKTTARKKTTLYLAIQQKENVKVGADRVIHQQNSSKRLFDIFVAASLLILSAPLLVVIAIAIRLTSKGPIVLKQTRLTDGGKKFAMYKFRSMIVDAESHSGPVLTQKNDCRITPLGKILRITRLDELPQLINVLRGDMSLIGPRPERPEIAAQLRSELPHFDRRLEVKAGLTGLAQVMMGYSSCTDSYRRKLAFDRLYVRHQSIALDTWIAFLTIWVMLTGRGAR